MHEVRTESKTVTVAAPLAAVWSAATDLARAGETMSHLVDIEVLTPGPFGKGTRWREVRRYAAHTAGRTMTVESVGRNEYVACGALGTTRCQLAYHLHALGPARTSVILDLHLEGSFAAGSTTHRHLPRPLSPEAVFIRLLGPDLVALARAAERDASSRGDLQPNDPG